MPLPSESQESAAPQPGADFIPVDLITITTAEQLKVISDPLRLEIIECISDETLTVKQIAARLKQPPTKLYYHVSALEEAGFIVVVETRQKGNILEKYYRLAAKGFTVDRSLLTPGGTPDAPFETMLNALFDSTIADLRASLAAGLIRLGPEEDPVSSNLVLSRTRLSLRPEDVPVFMKKFTALIEEMSKFKEGDESAPYACMIAFYPSSIPSERKKLNT